MAAVVALSSGARVGLDRSGSQIVNLNLAVGVHIASETMFRSA